MPETSTSVTQIRAKSPKLPIPGTGAKRATRPTSRISGILGIVQKSAHPFFLRHPACPRQRMAGGR